MRRPEGPPARVVFLAAVGVAALVASRGFGTGALAILGVGLVALPVIVTALVWAVAAGMRVERRVEPARCAAGDQVAVSVALRGWATGVGLDRLLDVAVDPGMDGAAAGAPVRTGDCTWRLAAVRGEHLLSAPRARVADPLGPAARTRRGAARASPPVVPRAPSLAGRPRRARARAPAPRPPRSRSPLS